MKAQLFYLKSQQDLKDEITPLLREHVYDDIEVELREISDDYSEASEEEEQKALSSYLYLLMASVVSTLKVGDFTFLVGESQSGWLYVAYGNTSETYLRLAQGLMTSVFPAVAVMDRMVLAPQGTLSAFFGSSELLFFPKPLDLQGVLLVDFEDSRAIEEAIQKLGVQLKSEIARLCRRYMFVNKIVQPDLHDLARLLNVKQGFLEQHKDQIFPSPVKLIPRIVSDPARVNQRSQVDLEITAESAEMLERVRVQVRAPAGSQMKLGTEMRRSVGANLDFSAGKPRMQKMSFELFPSTAPYCPLEVVFVLDEASENYVSVPTPVILRVVPAE